MRPEQPPKIAPPRHQIKPAPSEPPAEAHHAIGQRRKSILRKTRSAFLQNGGGPLVRTTGRSAPSIRARRQRPHPPPKSLSDMLQGASRRRFSGPDTLLGNRVWTYSGRFRSFAVARSSSLQSGRSTQAVARLGTPSSPSIILKLVDTGGIGPRRERRQKIVERDEPQGL